MPMFKCEWPNGDVSFVLARDVEDAVLQLDELGEAAPQMVKQLSEFLLDLRPDRKVLEANERARKEGRDESEWPWQLNEVGDCMSDPEGKILPSDADALRRIRKFEKEGKANAREQTLRARAERDGTLIDLTARRMAASLRRAMERSETETVDEP